MYKVELEYFIETGSKCLIGREYGISIRDNLNLKDLETENTTIKIVFPKDLYSASGPFLCGLLGDSYRRLRNRFYDKYSFKGSKLFIDKIQTDVVDYIERIDKHEMD